MEDKFYKELEEHQFVTKLSDKELKVYVLRGGFTPSGSVRIFDPLSSAKLLAVKPTTLVVLSREQAETIVEKSKEHIAEQILRYEEKAIDPTNSTLRQQNIERGLENLQIKLGNTDVLIRIIRNYGNARNLKFQ